MEIDTKQESMSDGHEDEIIHRSLDTERDSPGVQIAEIIADLENRDVNELTTLWDCIDHVLAELFSNPPSPEAQMEIAFSYEGYRITVEQSGRAEFIKTA